jgi:acyl-CoA thioester hydrolase
MFISTTQIRVRYGETDQMGYLYYGFYALYYEVGRTEAIRALGFSYKQLEDAGIIMPVIELQSKYLRPAYYDDLVTVKTILKELHHQKIEFHYELYNEKNKLLNSGVTTLVFLDAATKKKVNMPEVLQAKLLPYFQH